MRLVAVTISRQMENWQLPDIPHYCETWPMTEPVLDPFRYTSGLAKKRNMAVDRTLEKFPDATHILMCDSYYVPQVEPLQQLIDDYSNLASGKIILGGATWGVTRARGSDLFQRSRGLHLQWFDAWAVPELAKVRYNDSFKGLIYTSSVTGVFIFPRYLWNDGARFGQNRLLGKNEWHYMQGCELNYFCKQSPVLKMIDLDAKFYRERVYSAFKCVRVSLHLGRFLPWRREELSR